MFRNYFKIALRNFVKQRINSIYKYSLLSKDFVALVVVANILTWPLAWYGLHAWMQDSAYRVDMGWWLFCLAGAATVLIALLTVSFHSVRAALTNRVKSLRTE